MSHSDGGVGGAARPPGLTLGLLSQILPLPFHVFDAQGNCLSRLNLERDPWDVMTTDPELRVALLAETREKRLVIACAERPVLYGGATLGGGRCLIVGPVCLGTPDQAFSRLYAARHHAEGVAIMPCEARKLAALLMIVKESMGEPVPPLTSFLDENFLPRGADDRVTRRILQVHERRVMSSRPHNPDEFESAIIDAIAAGDAEGLLEALNSPFASMRGELSGDPLRSAKNLAVVDVTLATRAAISAGLPAEELYAVGDGFILEIEECRSPEEAASLARACAFRCARQVALSKRGRKGRAPRLLVRRARDYIEEHFGDKLDAGIIAAKVNASGNYLARLFKQDMGESIRSYVQRRRIELACAMLVHSQRPISEIAELLGFCSQSHFGHIFQGVTGTSPGHYRSGGGRPRKA
ncbi:MAG: AraC family transcriptional regulator [Succinivibrionaceae bacterium]|nr:AraC family transcriptional regulator [Succinivibrionaceae bacterium]